MLTKNQAWAKRERRILKYLERAFFLVEMVIPILAAVLFLQIMYMMIQVSDLLVWSYTGVKP